MKDRSKPTWDNQLWHAKRLLNDKGEEALNNPYAMIGRDCRCGTCFCCAAARVFSDWKREVAIHGENATGYSGGNSDD